MRTDNFDAGSVGCSWKFRRIHYSYSQLRFVLLCWHSGTQQRDSGEKEFIGANHKLVRTMKRQHAAHWGSLDVSPLSYLRNIANFSLVVCGRRDTTAEQILLRLWVDAVAIVVFIFTSPLRKNWVSLLFMLFFPLHQNKRRFSFFMFSSTLKPRPHNT